MPGKAENRKKKRAGPEIVAAVGRVWDTENAVYYTTAATVEMYLILKHSSKVNCCCFIHSSAALLCFCEKVEEQVYLMSSLKGKPKGSSFSKQLSIQLNVCKRMQKESSYYLKEVEENKAKVQKMKDEGKDPFDIKKQEEVLEESVMMVPDSKRRYGESVEKLVQLLVSDCFSRQFCFHATCREFYSVDIVMSIPCY